jgi:phytoene dehydrogenase-like protein
LLSALGWAAKGYRVRVIESLDKPSGRGPLITQDGHGFDLGSMIMTLPQVYEELRATCGC